LKAGDMLVFNDSKVIPARAFGRKPTGGKVEILLERALDHRRAWVKLKASKKTPIGLVIALEGGCQATVTARDADLFCLEFDISPVEYFVAHGRIPLPPYLERNPEPLDATRYQTIYAEDPGSVAAPTAGLHFDAAMFASLAQAGVETGFVTLHVGSGTFQPVRCENVTEHRMHAERISVDADLVQRIQAVKRAGGRIIAVGTTSLRSLEAASINGDVQPFSGETDIFILPGYRFRTVDALLTNFHLPESTLLMLVSALAGRTRTLEAYQHAIDERYRFFSYGDCMFVEQHPAGREET
ncbi:MAG: tRNA preQ1(34) S-adenosylmethionine ribosyltransferase-isomerase QueA, partial [Gammaproteobacteria bacterium]|nr:tRNA preQ1(34) S-adenosylmethionine ribosyltransferase-isomerase QueA [Gammaproteobacteria bacterium]